MSDRNLLVLVDEHVSEPEATTVLDTLERADLDATTVRPDDDYDSDDYDALVVPGGRVPATLRSDDAVQETFQHFHATGKPIAVMRHGTPLLAALGVHGELNTVGDPMLDPGEQATDEEWLEANVTEGLLYTAPGRPDRPEWLGDYVVALQSMVVDATVQ